MPKLLFNVLVEAYYNLHTCIEHLTLNVQLLWSVDLEERCNVWLIGFMSCHTWHV